MVEHHSIYQAMINAASQTLENMAFTEVMEHFDLTYEIPADDLAWTSILIHDPVQAEIRLAMPQSLMKNLTSNIFSIAEEEVTEIQMQDILHELLNTIAGLFMTNLLDDNQVYQLGLPETGNGELPATDADTLVWKLMTGDEAPLQIYAVGASLLALSEQ
jgi:CheY-specific phosphatase CheX